jgi:hypothetical protein
MKKPFRKIQVTDWFTTSTPDIRGWVTCSATTGRDQEAGAGDRYHLTHDRLADHLKRIRHDLE